jgi:hypothetical protein
MADVNSLVEPAGFTAGNSPPNKNTKWLIGGAVAAALVGGLILYEKSKNAQAASTSSATPVVVGSTSSQGAGSDAEYQSLIAAEGNLSQQLAALQEQVESNQTGNQSTGGSTTPAPTPGLLALYPQSLAGVLGRHLRQ